MRSAQLGHVHGTHGDTDHTDEPHKHPVKRHRGEPGKSEVSQSVMSRSHPHPALKPLHRPSIRLRRSRSTTSTEYSLPGATQLSQVTQKGHARDTHGDTDHTSHIDEPNKHPVKRHRGKPGHTRDTHGTHGRTWAHGSHRRTSQPSKPNDTYPHDHATAETAADSTSTNLTSSLSNHFSVVQQAS